MAKSKRDNKEPKRMTLGERILFSVVNEIRYATRDEIEALINAMHKSAGSDSCTCIHTVLCLLTEKLEHDNSESDSSELDRVKGG